MIVRCHFEYNRPNITEISDVSLQTGKEEQLLSHSANSERRWMRIPPGPRKLRYLEVAAKVPLKRVQFVSLCNSLCRNLYLLFSAFAFVFQSPFLASFLLYFSFPLPPPHPHHFSDCPFIISLRKAAKTRRHDNPVQQELSNLITNHTRAIQTARDLNSNHDRIWTSKEVDRFWSV